MMMNSPNTKIAPLQLTRPRTSAEWMEEPNLVLAERPVMNGVCGGCP